MKDKDSMDVLIEEVRGMRLAFGVRIPLDGPLTREQAAEYLGVHADTLYGWAREGLLPYSKLGDGEKAPLRFSRDDLDYFWKSRRRVCSKNEAVSRR